MGNPAQKGSHKDFWQCAIQQYEQRNAHLLNDTGNYKGRAEGMETNFHVLPLLQNTNWPCQPTCSCDNLNSAKIGPTDYDPKPVKDVPDSFKNEKNNITMVVNTCECEGCPLALSANYENICKCNEPIPKNTCECEGCPLATSDVRYETTCKCNDPPDDTPSCSCESEPSVNANFDNISIGQDDAAYVEKIRQMLENEKKLNKEVDDLGRAEKCFEERVQRRQAYSDASGSGDYEVLNLKRLNEKLEENNNMLEAEIEETLASIKHLKENVEEPMKREIEAEKKKIRDLEENFRRQQGGADVKRLSEEKELEFVRNQLQQANQYLSDLNMVNKRLKEELCMLNCRCNELQTDIINQKLSEIHTISRLQAQKRRFADHVPSKHSKGSSDGGDDGGWGGGVGGGGQRDRRSSSRSSSSRSSTYKGSSDSNVCPRQRPCPSKQRGGSEKDLNVIARNLSTLLAQASECNTCQCTNSDLIDTVKYIKDLVDMLNGPDQGGSSSESLPYCECGDMQECLDLPKEKEIDLTQYDIPLTQPFKCPVDVMGDATMEAPTKDVEPQLGEGEILPETRLSSPEEDTISGQELLNMLLDYLDVQLDERGQIVVDEEGRPITTDGTPIDINVDELGLQTEEGEQPLADELGRPVTPDGQDLKAEKPVIDETGEIAKVSRKCYCEEEDKEEIVAKVAKQEVVPVKKMDVPQPEKICSAMKDIPPPPIRQRICSGPPCLRKMPPLKDVVALTSDGKPVDVLMGDDGKPMLDESGHLLDIEGHPIPSDAALTAAGPITGEEVPPEGVEKAEEDVEKVGDDVEEEGEDVEKIGEDVPPEDVEKIGEDVTPEAEEKVEEDMKPDAEITAELPEGAEVALDAEAPAEPQRIRPPCEIVDDELPEGIMLDAEGKPVLDEEGHMITPSGHVILTEPGLVDAEGHPLKADGTPIDVMLDEHGQPILDEQGHMLTPSGHVVDTVPSPMLDEHGRPLAPDGTPIDVMLDEHGQPLLDEQGHMLTPSGHVLDAAPALGKPILDEQGRPIAPDGTPIGVMLDEHGQPLLDEQGHMLTPSGHVLDISAPAAAGVQVDEHGKPILDEQGHMLTPSGHVLEGPPLGPDGKPMDVMLDEHGQPKVDSKGHLLMADGTPIIERGPSAELFKQLGLQLDEHGQPVLDKDGHPIRLDGTPMDVLLDEQGRPVLDSDGNILGKDGVGLVPLPEAEALTNLVPTPDVEPVKIISRSTEGDYVTIAAASGGALHVTTEGPAGLIDTTVKMTDSGNFQVHTDMTEFEEEQLIDEQSLAPTEVTSEGKEGTAEEEGPEEYEGTTTEESGHTEIDEGAEGDVARGEYPEEGTDEESTEVESEVSAREEEGAQIPGEEGSGVESPGVEPSVGEGEDVQVLMPPVCEMEEEKADEAKEADTGMPPICEMEEVPDESAKGDEEVETLMPPVCEMEESKEALAIEGEGTKPCLCKSDKACQCTATDEACQCEDEVPDEEKIGDEEALPSLGVGDREDVDLSTGDLDHEADVTKDAAGEAAAAAKICKPDICATGDRGGDVRWPCECMKPRTTLCEECSKSRDKKSSKIKLDVTISCEQPCSVIKSRTRYQESDSSTSSSNSSDDNIKSKSKKDKNKPKSSRGVCADTCGNIGIQQNYYDLEETTECNNTTCKDKSICPILGVNENEPSKTECTNDTCKYKNTCPVLSVDEKNLSKPDCTVTTCKDKSTCPILSVKDNASNASKCISFKDKETDSIMGSKVKLAMNADSAENERADGRSNTNPCCSCSKETSTNDVRSQGSSRRTVSSKSCSCRIKEFPVNSTGGNTFPDRPTVSSYTQPICDVATCPLRIQVSRETEYSVLGDRDKRSGCQSPCCPAMLSKVNTALSPMNIKCGKIETAGSSITCISDISHRKCGPCNYRNGSLKQDSKVMGSLSYRKSKRTTPLSVDSGQRSLVSSMCNPCLCTVDSTATTYSSAQRISSGRGSLKFDLSSRNSCSKGSSLCCPCMGNESFTRETPKYGGSISPVLECTCSDGSTTHNSPQQNISSCRLPECKCSRDAEGDSEHRTGSQAPCGICSIQNTDSGATSFGPPAGMTCENTAGCCPCSDQSSAVTSVDLLGKFQGSESILEDPSCTSSTCEDKDKLEKRTSLDTSSQCLKTCACMQESVSTMRSFDEDYWSCKPSFECVPECIKELCSKRMDASVMTPSRAASIGDGHPKSADLSSKTSQAEQVTDGKKICTPKTCKKMRAAPSQRSCTLATCKRRRRASGEGEAGEPAPGSKEPSIRSGRGDDQRSKTSSQRSRRSSAEAEGSVRSSKSSKRSSEEGSVRKSLEEGEAAGEEGEVGAEEAAVVLDEEGHPIPVALDEEGHPIPVALDEDGHPIPVALDAEGHPIPVALDAEGHPIPVALDAEGHPIPVALDADGHPIPVALDADGHPIPVTLDADGHPIPVTLDADGHPIPVTLDADGHPIPVTLDADGHPIPVTLDADGHPIPVALDADGHPIPVTLDADGRPIPVTLDAEGHPVPVTLDAEGHPIPVTLDAEGHPVPVTLDAEGHPIPVTLDAEGHPIPVTLDAEGHPIPVTLDAEGHPIPVTLDAEGHPVPVTLDAEGHPIPVTLDAEGHPIPVTLDAEGHPIPVTFDAEGHPIPVTLDAEGHPIPVTLDAEGHPIPVTLDAEGHPIPVTLDAEGHPIPVTLDAEGHPIPVTLDAEGHPIPVTLDAEGHPIPVTLDAEGHPIPVTLDAEGHPIPVTLDAEGHPIPVTLDAEGHPIPVTLDAEGHPIPITLDAEGHPIPVTGDGKKTPSDTSRSKRSSAASLRGDGASKEGVSPMSQIPEGDEELGARGSSGIGSPEKVGSKIPVAQDRPHPVGCKCAKCNYSICECAEPICETPSSEKHPPTCACIDCICDPSKFDRSNVGDGMPAHPPDCACVDCLCDPNKGFIKEAGSETEEAKVAHKVPCDCPECVCAPCADETKPFVCPSFLPPHHPDCTCAQCLCEECLHVPDCRCEKCLCARCAHFHKPTNQCTCPECVCAPCGDTEKFQEPDRQDAGDKLFEQYLVDGDTPRTGLGDVKEPMDQDNAGEADRASKQLDEQGKPIPPSGPSQKRRHPDCVCSQECICENCLDVPVCECEDFVCENCADEAMNQRKREWEAQHTPECDCVQCKCNPCRDKRISQDVTCDCDENFTCDNCLDKNRKSKLAAELAAQQQHPMDCDCEACKCNPCADDAVEAQKQAKLKICDTGAQGEDLCDCWFCMCKSCKDPKIRAVTNAPLSSIFSNWDQVEIPDMSQIKNAFKKTADHPPGCQCHDCACDPCKLDPFRSSLSAPHGPKCTCPSCICGGTCREPGDTGGKAHGKECNCEKCVCDPCEDPIFRTKRTLDKLKKDMPDQHIPSCDCPLCRCSPCKDPNHGPGCKCPDCVCQPCPKSGSAIPPAESHPANCKCCVCSPCPQQTSQTIGPIDRHGQSCTCPICGPLSTERKRSKHKSKSRDASKSSKHSRPCKCEEGACTCESPRKKERSKSKEKKKSKDHEKRKEGSNKGSKHRKLSDDNNNIPGSSRDNVDRKKEIEELEALMEQIRCSCDSAEVDAACYYPGNTTAQPPCPLKILELQNSLRSFKEQCEAKDKIIEQMQGKLGGRPESGSLNALPNAGAGPCGICTSTSALVTIKEVKRISSESVLVKWTAPCNQLVIGYEISVDNVLRSRVHSSQRNSAVVFGVCPSKKVMILVHAITHYGRCEPPASYEFQS